MVQVRLTQPGRFVVVAAPSYPARRGAPQRPEDLLRHDCLGIRSDVGGPRYAWELERGKKEWRLPVHGSVTTNDPELMQLLAEAGVGLLYTFEPLVSDELRRGTLRIVLEEYACGGPRVLPVLPEQVAGVAGIQGVRGRRARVRRRQTAHALTGRTRPAHPRTANSLRELEPTQAAAGQGGRRKTGIRSSFDAHDPDRTDVTGDQEVLMPGYVDGFVIPLPKKQVKAYLAMAKLGARVWKDHGALGYRECIADDLKGFGQGFKKMAGLKAGETVVFSFILYRSRAHRDRVNAKVMKDPRMTGMTTMPFDVKRMAMGGFEVLLGW